MIQNQHQYQVTQNKLKDLEKGLMELAKIKDNLHPRQYLGRKNSLTKNIDALKQEISDYEYLKQPKIPIKIKTIADLPLALIKARIALGMTQKELAEKIGVQEQQVQIHESNQYSTCLLYTSPSPRDLSTSRMPSSA